MKDSKTSEAKASGVFSYNAANRYIVNGKMVLLNFSSDCKKKKCMANLLSVMIACTCYCFNQF